MANGDAVSHANRSSHQVGWEKWETWGIFAAVLLTVALAAVLTVMVGRWKATSPAQELRPESGAVLAWAEGDEEATIEEVAALPEEAWRPYSEIRPEDPRHGGHGMWFRVILPPSGSGLSLINSPSGLCFAARAYWQRDGEWKMQRGGQDLPMRERALYASEVGFVIDRPAGEPTTVYARFLEDDRPAEWMRYWENATEGRANLEVDGYIFIAYFAIWFAVLVYNLLLAIVLRRRAIFLYVFYVAAFGAMIFFNMSIDGLLFGVEPSLGRLIGDFSLVVLQVAALSWFERDLLGVGGSRRARRVFRAVDVLIGLCVLTPLLWWFDVVSGDGLLVVLGVEFFLIGAILIGFAAVRSWRGQHVARWFLLAFSPGVGAFLWLWATSSDNEMPEYLSLVPFSVGSVAEFVLMSLMLGFHYREIERENVRIKAEQAETLRREVEARTRELRELTAQLSASNRLKDRIFSVLGHDLRSPVATTISLAEVLEQDPTFLPPAELAAHAGVLKRTNEQLLQLLEDLLSWARAEGGQLELAFASVTLDRLVAAPVKLLTGVGSAKGVVLNVAVSPQLKVCVDQKTMQAVIRNLLSNALKFTPSGGRVSVRAEKSEDRVVLSVSDTGCGMTPQQVERLLNGEGGMTTEGTAREKGTGFGWVLCKQFVGMNGGELRVSSELNRGTTVEISLPPAEATAARVASSSQLVR